MSVLGIGQAIQPFPANSILNENYYDLIERWEKQYGDLNNPTPGNERMVKKIHRFMKKWRALAAEHNGDLRKAYNAYTQRSTGGAPIANNGSATAATTTTAAHSSLKMQWKELGPFNSGRNTPYIGRMNYVYFHPNNNDEIFACASVSGMFYSSDGGAKWQQVTDNMPTFNLGVSSVAISPARPNRWFVATGAGDEGIEKQFEPTEGIYYTDDKGATWHNFTPPSSIFDMDDAQIHYLSFHPNFPHVLFAATNKGLYRINVRVMNKNSWKKVLCI